jgi:hypothetical protein
MTALKTVLATGAVFVAALMTTGALAGGMDYETEGSLKDVEPAPPGIIYSAVIDAAAGAEWASGENDDSFELEDENYAFTEGDARVSVPLRDDISVQFDVGGLSTFTDRENGENQLQTYFYTGAHLTYRDPARYALGAFGLVGSSNGGENENATIGLFGLEAQKYWDNITFYGQGGVFYADDEDEGDVMTDAWFVRGVVRKFFDPLSYIEADLSYAQGEENEGSSGDVDTYDVLSWGLKYERMKADMPIAWFVEYKGFHGQEELDGGGSEDEVTTHAALVGLRFHFGGTSAIENDRRGATFDMPDVGRWTGWTMEVLD